MEWYNASQATPVIPGKGKQCARCGRRAPEVEFYPYRTKTGPRAWCKQCCRVDCVTRYQHKRDALDSLKLYLGCADCGYRGHPVGLDFDHLPQFEKSFAIASQITQRPLEALLAEALKCEVVCAICHRIRTAVRKQAEMDAYLPRPGWTPPPFHPQTSRRANPNQDRMF